MFTKLKDFKNIRKSMHLFSNDEGEELPGKQGKRLKSTASLPNKKNKGKHAEVPPTSDSDVEPDNRFEDAAVGQDVSEPERPKKQKKSKGNRTQQPASESDVEPDNYRTDDVAVGYDGNELERPQKRKDRKGKRTQEPPSDSDMDPDNRTEDVAVEQYGIGLERPQKKKKKQRETNTTARYRFRCRTRQSDRRGSCWSRWPLDRTTPETATITAPLSSPRFCDIIIGGLGTTKFVNSAFITSFA